MNDDGEPVQPESNGRLPDGRFGVGNRVGRGSKLHNHMAINRTKLMEAVSAEDLTQIAATLTRQAIGGDVAAAKVLLDHLCGRAPQSIDLSGSVGDGGPLLVA